MSMHTPETDPALQNASISDPACVKAGDACPAFLAAHHLSQKQVSYYHQYDYGHYVSWYLVATLSIFIFAHAYRKWIAERQPKPPSHNLQVAIKTIKALLRSITYRRIPGPLSDQLGLPGTGITILILLFALYCLVLSFAVRPYYRVHRGYGSPPLAIRTGLMAVALTPWLVALGGKANPITLLTGIGHEKLNVLHRWIARICLGLSVIHTLPFIVAPLRDGGSAALRKQFYQPGGFEYTGVPALAILIGIVALSIPWLRHRFYETFYLSHFLLAIAYFGLLFWHAGNEGDSWAYLWATLATWLCSTLVRAFWFSRATNIAQPTWFQGLDAQIQLLPGNVSKIEVRLRDEMRHRPGQHVFLRFPALAVWESHPFTLAWTSVQTWTFFVKSRRGFTKQLHASGEQSALQQVAVWIDGPYGGIDVKLEKLYDQAVLVAGGIGITGCLPWLQYLVSHSRDEHVRLSSVKLVWVVHEAAHVEWADPYLRELSRSEPKEFLHVEIYCTAFNRPSSPSDDLEKSSDEADENVISVWRPKPGRPSISAVVGELSGGRTVVIGCGPTSLKVDLSNACARAQLRVVKGELEELVLHTETFGW